MHADLRPDPPRPELAVVRATGDDWAAVRGVRLAALADSPSAFGSSLAREQQYDESRWRSWATTATVFLLTGDGEPCGMAAGLTAGPEDARHVVAVWVRPDRRGLGGADLLLDSVEQWARGEGARRVELWLTRGNLPARRTYARRGYADTGRSKPLPSNPDLLEDEMALHLA